MADFWKYHGLGNDYLVIEPGRFADPPGPEAVRLICDRTRGIGADGILLGPGTAPAGKPVPVRILNPDGSEAEKSGNGLRIFARHLWERGHVKTRRFAIAVGGESVAAEVLDDTGSPVALEMGQVSFLSTDIPVSGEPREVLRETLSAGGREWRVSGAGIGNPHCVVEVDDPTAALALEAGPLIEHHPWFPNRTNVQFMTPVDDHRIRIEIWERGAGHTLSSGTSSCAAAAVACRLGLCTSPVTVVTPGGELRVELDGSFHCRLEGPVAAVGRGSFHDAFLAVLGLRRGGGETG